jgi:hypothetical protein
MKDELRSRAVAAAAKARRGAAIAITDYVKADLSRRSSTGERRQKAVIALDFRAKQVRKPENSHFSRILAFWPFSSWNLLPCNPFQLKQTGGFLGFPEKFSGGGIWGGEGWVWKGRSVFRRRPISSQLNPIKGN